MDEMLIKYQDEAGSNGFDLGLLGESFSGMNSVLKDLAEMTGINGEIEIRTSKIKTGSVDLYNIITIVLNGQPFNSPQELYDFLQVVSPELHREAQEFLSGALDVRRDLNTYFAGHAFDAVIITEFVKTFITKSWQWASKQKHQVTVRDNELGEISEQKARKLHTMVNQGKFRRVLKPITQGNVTTIKIAVNDSPDALSASVTESNIDNYLPEEDQILPDFQNGTVHRMNGVLLNLQGARGDIIKIRVDEIDRRYSFITAKPSYGQNIEDYVPFFMQRVVFDAEVVRTSMYKRPEFVIRRMDITQQELLDSDENTEQSE